MTSRWMQQVKARNKQAKQKEGMRSLTITEKKHQRRKVTIGKNGYIIKVESIDEYLERQLQEATFERHHPKEPTRVLSRIFEVPSIQELSLNADEKRLISNFLYKPVNRLGMPTGEILLRPDKEISDVEKAILRYRRLTARKAEPIETTQDRVRAYARNKKEQKAASRVTFSFKE